VSKHNQGFTLIEIVISMAIYAILLVIMGITAVSFSEINSRVNNPSTLHRRTIAMQGFITNLWQEHNGDGTIDLRVIDDTVLFKVGEQFVVFENHQLIYGDRTIDSHELIDDLTITVKDRYVIFTFISESKPLVTFILLNAGGNVV
jgi:prepilin-type N-terminal cleavage/methylation domain-containing protein